MLPCLLPEVPHQAGHSRPAGTALPLLPHLSSGHTCSSQWNSRPPVSFPHQPLLEIVGEHKKAKDASASAEKVDSKAESLSPRKNSTICCSEHDGREVELFCETCEELICLKCAIKGGKHYGHDYKDINESFERYREVVTPSLEPMEKTNVNHC